MRDIVEALVEAAGDVVAEGEVGTSRGKKAATIRRDTIASVLSDLVCAAEAWADAESWNEVQPSNVLFAAVRTLRAMEGKT